MIIPISFSFATETNNKCGDEVIDKQIEIIIESLDENKIKNTPINDPKFKEMTAFKNYEFTGIGHSWTMDETKCIPTLDFNRVNFALDKKTENYKIITVILDMNYVVNEIVIEDSPVSHGAPPIPYDNKHEIINEQIPIIISIISIVSITTIFIIKYTKNKSKK